ncbi:MAG: hypothetical protein ACK5Y5_09235, partial [Gemmatimonas sp.]|uniref:hypothetical protein n=1 Tax=Gemmatimonas sp. TaxID=1962908 RepID=UPI00391F06AD
RDAPKHLREPGFIVDHGHGNARQEQEWVESDVAKSFWVGIHSKGRATRHVRTYRCPRCGYLESYADDSDA